MSSTRKPFPIGRRGAVILAIVAAAVWACVVLDLRADYSRGGAGIVGDFFSRAWRPALTYESEPPAGTTPLPVKAAQAAYRTVIFAAAAMGLSVVAGLLLGFPASSAWWEGDPARPGGRLRRALAPALYGATRTFITLMRSVHELLWAVIFLAAFGLNTFAAVIAIAIPYAGTLAKIFSEMIDETARDSGAALRASGASPLQVFVFGLLPRAAPDMASYAFYRFECAIRSSAILGFFGYETLGYFIKASFDNVHYGEVWTYLYTLFALVIVLDAWSGSVRRRFVGYE